MQQTPALFGPTLTQRTAMPNEDSRQPGCSRGDATPYIYPLPALTSFTGKGVSGYTFGPLRGTDLDIYYIEVEKGHDTFMVSKKITRIYYVLSGSGYFTIAGRNYDVSPGLLVEVPPKVEFCYSGKMKLLAV